MPIRVTPIFFILILPAFVLVIEATISLVGGWFACQERTRV
jgi:hypothetical protein